MLPEQYCDYLLALYCQGELPPANLNKTWSDKKDILSGLLIGALFAFIVFLNYFTEIPIRMQMLVTTISIIAFGLAVRRFIGRKIIFQMALMGLALSLLLLNNQFGRIHGTRQSGYPLCFLVHKLRTLDFNGQKTEAASFLHSEKPRGYSHCLLFNNIIQRHFSGFKW
ncbi:hypothetical protein [Peribacillus simplex]